MSVIRARYRSTLPTVENEQFTDLHVDANGRLLIAAGGAAEAGVPTGSIQNSGASGNVANAPAVATLNSDAGKTTYISGFTVTASGATAASVVSVVVSGTLGGSLTYTFSVPAGATVAATPLNVVFNPPYPASGLDVDIVVTVPALGAGNTNASVVATGFKI